MLPSRTHAPDAHYLHLVNDVIEGGKMRIEDGGVTVLNGHGLGITLIPVQSPFLASSWCGVILRKSADM